MQEKVQLPKPFEYVTEQNMELYYLEELVLGRGEINPAMVWFTPPEKHIEESREARRCMKVYPAGKEPTVAPITTAPVTTTPWLLPYTADPSDKKAVERVNVSLYCKSTPIMY